VARKGPAVSRRDLPSTLLVIVGPTGSGKTDLAHALALEEGGEVVSADAFAVYRGLDIGTAKPSPERQREVRYHMVSVAEPWEPFSAGRFASEARPIVEQIARRGRLPILCGGSGFYVSALLGGLPPGPALAQDLRPALARWARMRGPEAAHRFLSANDPVAAARIPPANLKYTLRALEILLSTGEAASARAGTGDDWAAAFRVRKLGLLLPRAQLHARIEDRVRRMLESGWGEEVRRLLEGGLSRDSNSFQAIGYREVAEWVLGRISREEAEEQIVSATRSLAKRQMTWFARERDIRWVGPDEGLTAGRALLSEATDEETR
jgi:tRNA dimethylallyltransferase